MGRSAVRGVEPSLDGLEGEAEPRRSAGASTVVRRARRCAFELTDVGRRGEQRPMIESADVPIARALGVSSSSAMALLDAASGSPASREDPTPRGETGSRHLLRERRDAERLHEPLTNAIRRGSSPS